MEEFADTAIGSGFAVWAAGCGLGAGKFAAAIRVVSGELSGTVPGTAEGVDVVETASVGCGCWGAEGTGAATGCADGWLDAGTVGVWMSRV